MASSPLRSPTGEIPQSPTPLSPQSFHSPLQSPSHGPTSSDNHSTPPSPSLNNKNNTTGSFSGSPTNGSLQSQIPRSPNSIPSPLPSPSRGALLSGNHTNSPSSLHNTTTTTTTNSPLRSLSNRPTSLSHLSIPHSPSNNNIQENHKENQSNSKRVSSPKLYPLHLRSSKPSIQIRPPTLNSLSESEPSPFPSPSSLAIIPNPINESNKHANFDEEAIDSPLRTVNLDRSDGPGRVTGRGDGGNTVVAEAVWRSEVRWAAMLLRVLAAVLCLVSFSVMAADRTKGWDGDSYQRYEEYRFVLTVNVITFVYSSLQLFTEIYLVTTRKHLIRPPLSYYMDLTLDQILAYLLMSSSSVAASHNDIWVSRFGGDEFTRKINASVAMSFLAFIALALNSVISTYVLFRWLA